MGLLWVPGCLMRGLCETSCRQGLKLKSHVCASGSWHVEILRSGHHSCQQEPRDLRDPNIWVMTGSIYIVSTNSRGPENDEDFC